MDFGKWLLDVMGRLDTTPAEDVDLPPAPSVEEGPGEGIEHRERPHSGTEGRPLGIPHGCPGALFFPHAEKKVLRICGGRKPLV